MQLLSAALVVFILSLVGRAASIPALADSLNSGSIQLNRESSTPKGEKPLGREIDFKEFVDLDEEEDADEEYDYLLKENDANPSVESLTHLHRKNGEILVPCFGMWWPVGGAPAPPPPPIYYDYGEEYYDDYGRRKRRRRAKKRRAKKAKMKKKKKA